MARLEDVPLQTLREALDEFDDRRPLVRLLAAILYKQGPSVPTIADWLDVRPATVYGWFDRIERADTLQEGLHDAPRAGRPAKLSADERRALFEQLQEPPSAAGYDDATWTPASAQALLQEQFDVEYSKRHVRRLLKEAEQA